MIKLEQQTKVTVDFPFQMLANQFEVLRELTEMEGESLSEYIKWCVIKTVEMYIEQLNGGGAAGRGLHEKLVAKWGLESCDWPEEVDEESGK